MEARVTSQSQSFRLVERMQGAKAATEKKSAPMWAGALVRGE